MCLCVWSFWTVLPERILGPLTLLLARGSYVPVIALIRIGGSDQEATAAGPTEDKTVGKRDLVGLGVLFVVLVVVSRVAPATQEVVAILLYLAMIPAGPLLFLYNAYRVLRSRVH